MKSFIDEVSILVQESNLPKAEIARRANFDRSTLHKILSGQRVPTREQLTALLTTLHASPEQSRALLSLYARSREDPVVLSRRDIITAILRSLSMPADLQPITPLNNAQGSAQFTHDVEVISNPSAVRDCLDFLLAEYISAEDMPLMLSPTLDESVFQQLFAHFSRFTSEQWNIWQLSQLAKIPRSSSDQLRNLSMLSNSIPLLLLDTVSYEARFTYASTLDIGGSRLLPCHILFPNAALLLSENCHSGLLIRKADAVQYLRDSYTRYFNASSCVSLKPHHTDVDMALKANFSMYYSDTPRCTLRWDPPLLYCSDEEIVRSLFNPHNHSTALSIDELISIFHNAQRGRMSAFFCEQSVAEFLQTGQVRELPDDVYTRPDPSLRKVVLSNLIRMCASDECILRLINPNLLPIDQNTYIEILRGEGVLFTRVDFRSSGELLYKKCFVSEDTTTDSFWDYFQFLPSTRFVYSKEETLSILNRYLEQYE